MVNPGSQATNYLLKATFLLRLHNEIEDDLRPIYVFKIAKKIPLNPTLTKVVYNVKNP